jgi:hypothetical protein
MAVILPRDGVTIDEVLDYVLDLLTTLTHDSEQQVITAPSLISTFHKSFPARNIFTSSSHVTDSNTGGSSASALTSSVNGGSLPTVPFLHSLLYRADSV